MGIVLTVYGSPVAQGRPRATTIAGHVTLYDPADSKHYKQYVRAEALKVKPPVSLVGPLNVAVKVFLAIPGKYQTKPKRAMIEAGTLRPTTRPDLSNYIKGIEDALNGILWADDSQIVSFDGSGKWYADVPRIEVYVEGLSTALHQTRSVVQANLLGDLE